MISKETVIRMVCEKLDQAKIKIDPLKIDEYIENEVKNGLFRVFGKHYYLELEWKSLECIEKEFREKINSRYVNGYTMSFIKIYDVASAIQQLDAEEFYKELETYTEDLYYQAPTRHGFIGYYAKPGGKND